MKRPLAISIYLCAMLSAVSVAEGQGWRGIVPLHSTRADVERLLGVPTHQNQASSVVYSLGKEVVIFDYTSGSLCGARSGWRVPPNTVVEIIISPKVRLQFSELNLDESKYRKTNDEQRPEIVKYIDENKGESITVFAGDIINITHFPSAKDNHLRCPTAATTPSTTNRDDHDYHAFDVYRKIPFEAEQSRLDNLAIHLQQKPETKGYIIVYAGQRDCDDDAQARARRAKNYLVNVRHIEEARVVTIDGGYREELTVELYLVPRNLPAPVATPTVELRKVSNIKNSKVKKSNCRSRHSRRKQP